MDSSEKKYHRSELARRQLRTAVMLFLNEKDLSSVITLSAAASNILSQLVRNSGNESFVDHACRVHDAFNGSTPKRTSYKNYIDNMLGINVHKHMSPLCPKTCTLNLYKCAIDSLTIAIADYVTLYGQNDDFVRGFLSWSWTRADRNKIIEAYHNMPDKLKRSKKRHSKMELETTKDKLVVKEKKSQKRTYKRFQLASNQLETAIMLFLTKIDKLSAITLAGAADVILSELVNREGKKNFTELLLEKENEERSREEVGNEINNLLCINALKHFDKGDLEHIEMDEEESAVATILKALANYNMLEGKNDKLIIAFRYWVSVNLDPERYNFDPNPNQ
ncbi:TPA: hypothetical protein JBF07_04615 [Legionella pneumophila]|nr:hypothetical protein [Legionella pneumophila]